MDDRYPEENVPIHANDIRTLTDLRRRRSRDFADVVVQRAQLLLPEDRALVCAVYRDNLTAAQVAELTGVSPRAVRRRLHTLTQRLLSPRYEFVTRRQQQWGPTRRRVAVACAIHGMTLRAAAEHLSVSLHTVRRHMDAVAAQLEALRA